MSALVVTAAWLATAAHAGPPFLTDDPEPTGEGHWEIYAPLFEAEGSGTDFQGSFGAEINYGPVKDVQLTLDLPVAYTHNTSGWTSGAGDVAVSVKYRFYDDEAAGLQIAVFPGITLPTASKGLGAGHVTALLPIWAQKDLGKWSVFGGGGCAINPGAGNRNYWTGGIAVTRQFGSKFLVGVEADRKGADVLGGHAATSLGIGVIYDLPGPLRLLASGGPTFEDRGGQSFHAFAAVGVDF
ncbi:MAG: transporter [Novosphingobium sp.]